MTPEGAEPMTSEVAQDNPEWVEVKPATPCDGCERGICHNHGRYHIPGCWPCIWSKNHTGFHCLCERVGSADE